MQAWHNFLLLLEGELGIETVHKWLRPLKIIRYDACNLYLEAKDSFQLLWFEEHVRQKTQVSLLNNNNKRIKIHLSVANAPPTSKSKPKQKKEPLPQEQTTPKFSVNFDELDPEYLFEHFITAEQNQLPLKLLYQTSGWHPEAKVLKPPELAIFNPLYIHGSSGTGKTHLLMATTKVLREQGINAVYVRAETFTEHVVKAIRGGEMSAFRQAYRTIDVLLIDDVHIFSRKGATQEELFHTFNTLHLGGKQIILSANCSPGELQLIEPRLISRFEWGLVVALEALNKHEAAMLLEKKAVSLNTSLHPKVIEFLIETFASSIKNLMRAFQALILRLYLSHSSLATAVTIPLVKHHLADLILEEERNVITPTKIIQAVVEFYGIRPEDVLSKAQKRDNVQSRQLAMYLCRHYLKMPYTKIGALFSKDHSTVMSSVKNVQNALDEDEQSIVAAINSITKKLKSSPCK